MLDPVGPLASSPVIYRHPENPILTSEHVPYGPLLVFNVGVTRYQGKYVMAFRNDYGQKQGDGGQADGGQIDNSRSDIGLAFSDDGVHWQVHFNEAIRTFTAC